MNHYMLGAWVARSQDLQEKLQQMVAAPGLFKTEHVEATLVEFSAAQAWVRYWMVAGS